MRVFNSWTSECILGIDLGATFLRVACVDANGGEFLSVPTPTSMEAEEVVTSIVTRARKRMHVGCLGMSRAPGIDSRGCVGEWPSRPQWKGLPLISWLERAADAPVVSADDGVCATLWEHHSRLDAPESGVTACVGIGTGLAVGIMSNDEIIPSGDGADTLGHQRFASLDLPCTCGQRGCLQAVLCVQGLERMKALGRIDAVREAFYEFVGLLRRRHNVELVVLTGGGVDRFGAGFLKKMLAPSALAAGVELEESVTPALSAAGGALLLAADRCGDENDDLWVERIRDFACRESMGRQRPEHGFGVYEAFDPVLQSLN